MLYKVNPYLKDIVRADWLTPTQQEEVIHNACQLQLNGNPQPFKIITEGLVWIKSFEKGMPVELRSSMENFIA